MNFKLIIAVVFLIGLSANAQKKSIDKENPPVKVAQIKVMPRVQKDKILLRWGVTTAMAWKKLNKYGYTLERYTITRDNQTLATPEKKVLETGIKPEPMATWEKLIDTNDNAAILAQAIYGEGFKVGGIDKIQDIVNQSDEAEQRFTFALLTADNDFEMAKKAGLGYEDATAQKNEMYLYRLVSNVPIEQLNIKYGGVFTGLKEYEELPKPIYFTAHFSDKGALLSWNFKILATTYGQYYVERSLDKVHFERITPKPYTGMNQETSKTGALIYADSITNNKEYSYRIQGINAFGETGPYSEIASGKSKEKLKHTAHLTTKNFIDDNSVKLTWEFPEEGNSEISGFELNWSENYEEANYKTVVKNIPAQDRSVTYNKLQVSNYFTISALGKNGDKTTSFAMMVQPIDSLPPDKPKGLKATIDSLGTVKISWDTNKEKDLMGYRIFRANNPTEEYSQLTVSPTEYPFYYDCAELKSLNSKLYYKIIATDKRYNNSEFSEALMVKKPDVVPPSAPVFTNYEVKDSTVLLEWANSASDDVQAQLLYRKENDQKDWQLILEDKNKLEKHQDKTVVAGNTYHYALFAKDDSKLVSAPSPNVAVTIPKSNFMPAIKGFYAQVNAATQTIDLSWSYKEPDVAFFEIYKAIGDQPLQLMQQLLPTTKQLADPTIIINTNYKYGIRALFADGRMSPMEFFTVKF
jgi:uncharacterized protein